MAHSAAATSRRPNPWLRAGVSALTVLALTSVHHAYGAAIYDAPFRSHVVMVALPLSLLLAGLLAAGALRRGTRAGGLASVLALLLILAGPVAAIGIYEGGYNHLVKIALHALDAPADLLARLFPPPLYEAPRDLVFEATGGLQFLAGLIAGRDALRLARALAKPEPAGWGDVDGSQGLNRPRMYDALLFAMTRGRESAFRQRLLDEAGIERGMRVLDVGCGTGTLAAAAYARVGPDGSVTGVDLSPKMLEAAGRKAGARPITLRQAKATALPFPDGGFDVVTITTVLHMLPEGERLAALREAARVLRKGGRLLLVDYAGGAQERQGWVARHHLHQAFDLYELAPELAGAGLAELDRGPLGWLSLHALRAVKT